MAIKYRDLDKAKREIRVLILKPANRLDDPLRGTLQCVELHKARFQALSYVWGQIKEDKSDITIKIERTGLHHLSFGNPTYLRAITSSLSRALRHLRQKYGEVTLWVDDLCINQTDAKEKKWQVRLMDSIYSQAEAVHAWLGPEYNRNERLTAHITAQFNLAFRLATKVWTLAENLGTMSSLKEQDWLELCVTLANSNPDSTSEWSVWAEQLRAAVKFDRLVMDGLSSVDVLSCNTYFSRVWILQEGGRARKLIFHYGTGDIEHRPLLLLLSLTYSLYQSGSTTHMMHDSHAFDARFLRCLAARTTCLKSTSLLDVLVGEYLSPPPLHAATNPRDLVYARLGLSNDSSAIDVNYEAEVGEVFATTSRFLLGEGFTGTLTIFKPYLNMQWEGPELLPSWAHDWSKMGVNLFNRHDAAPNTSQMVPYRAYRKGDLKHAVIMKGVKIGQIYKMNNKFSTIATACGITKDAIRLARLRVVQRPLPAATPQNIASDIKSGHQQLGVSITDQDLASIFAYESLPFASFWCWWVYWVITLTKMIEEVEDVVDMEDAVPQDIAELIFRDQPEAGNLLNAGRFESREDLSTLLDYDNWSQLLQDDEYGRNAVKESIVAQSAEILFRSAWGLRCAILDNGRLGYVPEETEVDDEVIVFLGVKAPLVIRKRTRDAYRIIGPAHICGVMQGQVMTPDVHVETYTLV